MSNFFHRIVYFTNQNVKSLKKTHKWQYVIMMLYIRASDQIDVHQLILIFNESNVLFYTISNIDEINLNPKYLCIFCSIYLKTISVWIRNSCWYWGNSIDKDRKRIWNDKTKCFIVVDIKLLDHVWIKSQMIHHKSSKSLRRFRKQ